MVGLPLSVQGKYTFFPAAAAVGQGMEEPLVWGLPHLGKTSDQAIKHEVDGPIV